MANKQEPKPQTTRRIKEAAELVVKGTTWREIAVVYGYKNENSACHMLTCAYPDLWKQAYEQADSILGVTVRAEALLTLRELMRPTIRRRGRDGKMIEVNNDPRVQQSSAHSLLHDSRARMEQKMRLEISGPSNVPLQLFLTPLAPGRIAAAAPQQVVDPPPEPKALPAPPNPNDSKD